MKKLLLRFLMRFRVWCYRARKIAMIFGLIIAILMCSIPFASAEVYNQYLFANGDVKPFVRWRRDMDFLFYNLPFSAYTPLSSFSIYESNGISPYNGNYVQLGANQVTPGGTAFKINKSYPLGPGESVMFMFRLDGHQNFSSIDTLEFTLQWRTVNDDSQYFTTYHLNPAPLKSNRTSWYYVVYTNDIGADLYLFNFNVACSWLSTVYSPNINISCLLYEYMSPDQVSTWMELGQLDDISWSLTVLENQISGISDSVNIANGKLNIQGQKIDALRSEVAALSAKIDNLENGWTYIPGQSGVDPPSAPSDPPPPPDTSDFDDAVGTEDDLLNSEQIQSGLDQAQNSADQAQNSLYNFAAGLSAVKIMFETFEFHPIFSCLLWVSVFLGLFTVLLNLGTSFIRGGKK